MGNSNQQKIDFFKKAKEKFESLIKQNQNLEKELLLEEINKRSKTNKIKEKFDLNIFIYADYNLDERILKYFNQYDEDIFNRKIRTLIGFSQGNTDKIINSISRNGYFKNIIIIPIQSMSDLKNKIECETKAILKPFNELSEEKQPFFLILDDEVNDFFENKFDIIIRNKQENERELDYEEFNKEIIENIIKYKRIDSDFQLRYDFLIVDVNIKILLKEYIQKLKDNKEDFEILVNNNIFYQHLYNSENFEISSNSNFENELRDAIGRINEIHITIIIYNIKICEYNNYYELFKVTEVEFSFYEFKKHELISLFRKNKYENLDIKNFNIIRFKNSLNKILLKYVSYFNQIGDILFCNQIPYHAKINIAVTGFIGSGKSSLINAIVGEKICLEGKKCSNTYYITKISLKNYPINLYELPGIKMDSDSFLPLEKLLKSLSNLEKMDKMNKEIIHCILFCINCTKKIYERDLEKAVDFLAKLKIRVFFIITESENEVSEQFQNVKNAIIKYLNILRFNYNDFNKIFGNDLNNSIIPVLSKDKKINRFTTLRFFGLDNLFRILYEYFSKKKIDINKEIIFDNERMKKLIENNELLKEFDTKIKLCEEFKIELAKIFENINMKLYFNVPRYIYKNKEDNGIINEFMEQVFYLFHFYFNQKNNINKLQYLNKLRIYKNKIDKEFYELFKIGELFIINFKEDFKNTSAEEKFSFPIAAPFYYTLGTPVMKILSSNNIGILMNNKEIIDNLYKLYFKELIEGLNNAIDSLNSISNLFEESYLNN